MLQRIRKMLQTPNIKLAFHRIVNERGTRQYIRYYELGLAHNVQ